MVVKLKFKESSERERVKLVKIKEKACLLSLLIDKKVLTRLILKYQKENEYLIEIEDVDL